MASQRPVMENFNRHASTQLGSKRINVLTLDGGGVRGLSTLLILRALMQKINESIQNQRGKATKHEDVEPRHIFDLVAGTSTGGLIAIMLGKLGMTVDQCIDAYYRLSATIFGKKHLRARLSGGLATAKYSGSGMRCCVRDLIHEHRSNADLPMAAGQTPDQIACALICREYQERSRYSDFKADAAFLCSLPCSDTPQCLVCDAARATSAAPTFFPIQKIDNRYFADGGMEFNNPTLEIFNHYTTGNRVAESRRTSVATEAAVQNALHGNLDFSNIRFINLGTGTEPILADYRNQKNNWAFLVPGAFRMLLFLKRNLTKMATNSERVAGAMKTIARVSRNGNICTKYERFSADNGVCFIKMDKHKKLADIECLTLEYLQSEVIKKRLDRVAKEIAEDYLANSPTEAMRNATDRLAVPDHSGRPSTPESRLISTSCLSTEAPLSTKRRSPEQSDGSMENTPIRHSTSTAPSSLSDAMPLGLASASTGSRLTDGIVKSFVENGPLLLD